MKRKLALLLALIMVIAVFASCGDGSASGGDKIAVYNIGVMDETLDPANRHTTGSVNIYININGYLYRMNLQGEWEPELAKGYTISDDGLEWTIELKPDLKFSTGNPITADDVIFSWIRAADPKYGGEYAWIMEYIKGAAAFTATDPDDEAAYQAAYDNIGLEKINDLTVKVTLENPTPFFFQLLGYNTYAILDSKFCKEVGDRDIEGGYGSTVEKTSSAGPFIVTEWKKDEYFLATKNPNYYDADKVKLDGIKFTFVQNVATELNLYETGEIDLTNLGMTPADLDYYQSQGKLNVLPTLGTGWLGYNCVKAPYDDVRVRLALVKALDLESLCNNVIGGGVRAPISFNPSGMPSPANPSESFVNVPYIDPKGEIEEAQRLLAEAGYPNGEGFPTDTKLSYGVTSDVNRAITEAMCAMWKDNLNIIITPDGQESKARLDNRMSGEFDITFQGWGADVVDPCNFLDCLRSDHFYNYGKYNNPDFDAAMANSAKATEPERTAYLREAERILMEDMPVIVFQESTKTYLQSERLINVCVSPLAIFDLKWADLKE